ncbi:MAG: acyl-CoA dehydrogenase family protein [Chloroflexi bacterium]|nr:acyl-CoA dehydrogenase family protein [Chloroflexota bacterium]MCY3581085.1 acyl-CoA dehydrogenase family protein [Chloroflexota bacterium]MCY3715638.1 acyl-CoA dehydrogenase family protein [Chloroflexota bacterium]MXV93482.1 acyl-CoA dehydrogenase [Chloroflexota bacterium]MXX50497.1 acyl-CoA dehydrogenase [Chloroflexota bacterium]
MDFNPTRPVEAIVHRIRQFLDDYVIPLETDLLRSGADLRMEQLQELRAGAKAAGLWAPTMPSEWGGMGLHIEDIAPVFEAAGRSLLGPLAMGCAAPDEGNMHLLLSWANAEQVERFLLPLARGEAFSAFSMTEPPPGAGSDPRMIQSSARLEGDTWRINGHKWLTTNGEIADFFIIMARTDWEAHPYQGCTLFLAPRATPGINILRDVPVMGAKDFGGHIEVAYEDLRLPANAVLGKVGQGFMLAQARLGPARLTHCMRWTGIAQRALEIATAYASQREAFGGKLTSHQSVQWMLADSAMELKIGRLLINDAAQLLAEGQQARVETSIAKLQVSEIVCRVLDRCVQICGGRGISRDLPLSTWYEKARAFRIYDGASEVHRMVVARDVIKRYSAG